jgi:hypothetical protein
MGRPAQLIAQLVILACVLAGMAIALVKLL